MVMRDSLWTAIVYVFEGRALSGLPPRPLDTRLFEIVGGHTCAFSFASHLMRVQVDVNFAMQLRSQRFGSMRPPRAPYIGWRSQCVSRRILRCWPRA